ncbi:hemopexin repeat-containing protein [Streptomyces sp. SID8352]|uniref:hemopexin repeat-containing protein n=1 Tax=Streptomyces sp. SID8352 TaxID=2690338 RepID=UPI00136C517F|nr:hemopexin repeat-containing protein [Streptomyces sp. SID8352]MYU21006.1 hypothetical protein [Streptomyces sp. SID8352]
MATELQESFYRRIDAVLRSRDEGQIAWFLKDTQYVRYDLKTDEGVNGAKPIAGHWAGLPDSFTRGIDAALNRRDQPTVGYLFKDDQYVRYNLEADEAAPGYPKTIAEGWTGLPAAFQQGLDAAVNHPSDDEIVWFFKDDQYVRYNVPEDKVVVGPRRSRATGPACRTPSTAASTPPPPTPPTATRSTCSRTTSTSATTSKPTAPTPATPSPSRATGTSSADHSRPGHRPPAEPTAPAGPAARPPPEAIRAHVRAGRGAAGGRGGAGRGAPVRPCGAAPAPEPLAHLGGRGVRHVRHAALGSSRRHRPRRDQRVVRVGLVRPTGVRTARQEVAVLRGVPEDGMDHPENRVITP